MACSLSMESLIPIVRQANALAHNNNALIAPRYAIRKFSSLKARSQSVLQLQGRNVAAGLKFPAVKQIRFICGRENCADPCDFPPCSPEAIAKTECMKKRLERKEKKQPLTVYEVYWNRPECCANECIDSYPRFDDMYYRESDKEKRIYTQTWAECPELIIAPKPICCSEKIKLPPLCKRAPKDKPKTACAPQMSCEPDPASPCPKITMPCCRPARQEPCKIAKTPKDCKKFNAPSPAFSECRKGPIRPMKITECWCLAVPSMCQVWEEWRRLQRMKRR